ncbi:MAG: M57 family metalloprotease [Bacteroidota bacterium]
MKHLKILIFMLTGILIFSCTNDDQKNQANGLINDSIVKRQAGLGDGWEPAACVNITLYIDPDACGPNWEASLPAAIAQYNSVPGVAIQMEQVFSPPADIEITCADFANNNSFGLGEWPENDGEIGGNIFMNTDFETTCADACFYTGSMMHEISHNLGFAHGEQEGGNGAVGPWTLNADGTFTQVNDGAATGLEHIEGTPNGLGDPSSVFNVHNCASPNCTFSEWDIVALQSFYPCADCDDPDLACQCPNIPIPFTPALDGPLDLCEDEIGTYCVTGIDPGWTATMTANGNSTILDGDLCLDVSYATAGIYNVFVRVCSDNFPDCCTDVLMEVHVVPEDGECYCVCEAQEQHGPILGESGKNIKGNQSIKGQIEEWKFPVDCCDPRPCSELIPGWWYEYLVDADECFVKENDCTPPAVGLQGDDEVCAGQTIEICIGGSFNSSTSWSGGGGILSYSSPKCRNFTANTPGTYTVSVEVCNREDGEGQEDCCITITHTIDVVDCPDECFCRCWVEEQSGDDGPYQEDIPVDCNDPGDCADIIPDWWYEYLVFPVDCERI